MYNHHRSSAIHKYPHWYDIQNITKPFKLWKGHGVQEFALAHRHTQTLCCLVVLASDVVLLIPFYLFGRGNRLSIRIRGSPRRCTQRPFARKGRSFNRIFSAWNAGCVEETSSIPRSILHLEMISKTQVYAREACGIILHPGSESGICKKGPHHNRGQLQSLAAWTIQWRVNSPSCCWTAMKSKKLTCLEFCNAICLAGFFERFTHWCLIACKRATKGWGAKLSMFLTVANCWIERLRKGRSLATWWASLAPTSSSVHLFATNNWVYQTSTPNTTMHQISTNHL